MEGKLKKSKSKGEESWGEMEYNPSYLIQLLF